MRVRFSITSTTSASFTSMEIVILMASFILFIVVLNFLRRDFLGKPDSNYKDKNKKTSCSTEVFLVGVKNK